MQITDAVKKTEVRNIKERTEGERLGESKTTIGYKPYTPEIKKLTDTKHIWKRYILKYEKQG